MGLESELLYPKRLLRMKFPGKRWVWIIVLIVYVVAYTIARSTNLLIHRESYSGKAQFHRISRGDFIGFSSNASLAGVSYLVFTPLRWLEAVAWKVTDFVDGSEKLDKDTQLESKETV